MNYDGITHIATSNPQPLKTKIPIIKLIIIVLISNILILSLIGSIGYFYVKNKFFGDSGNDTKTSTIDLPQSFYQLDADSNQPIPQNNPSSPTTPTTPQSPSQKTTPTPTPTAPKNTTTTTPSAPKNTTTTPQPVKLSKLDTVKVFVTSWKTDRQKSLSLIDFETLKTKQNFKGKTNSEIESDLDMLLNTPGTSITDIKDPGGSDVKVYMKNTFIPQFSNGKNGGQIHLTDHGTTWLIDDAIVFSD